MSRTERLLDVEQATRRSATFIQAIQANPYPHNIRHASNTLPDTTQNQMHMKAQ